MKKANLYEAIFRRKSIRKYELTSLDGNTIAEISAHMDDLKPMYDNIKTEMKIISQNDVKQRLMKKAPHYIAVFSENKEGYLSNVGFMLQQMDLFLSANGIGSCFQGIPKPKGEILKSTELEFVIVLAFGKPTEPLHRENISEFKRKPLEQITDISGADELLEPVRIAPSSTNSQPWFFTGGKNIFHAYCAKLNFIKAVMFKKLNKIDMGIAMYHLQISAEHFGKKTEIIFDKEAKDNPPKGYYYIASLKVE